MKSTREATEDRDGGEPLEGAHVTGRIGPTYASRTEWRRQQALLPVGLRMGWDEEPDEEYVSWGRMLVHVDRYTRPEAPAKLVLLHGGGGNGRLLAPYALMAYRAGYETVAPDLPGYGLTVLPDKRSLTYEDWNAFTSDFVRAEHARDGRPVVLFGLSIGGLLAYEAAARTRVPAAVVATCFLDPRRQEVRRAVVLRPWMAPLVGPALEIAKPLTDSATVRVAWVGNVDAIVNDPGMAREIVADPLASGNWMPGRWFRGFLNESPTVEPEDFDACPVLLAHPADDRWTPVGVSLPFFERLSVEKRLVMLGNAGHAPIEEPGVDQLRGALLEIMAESAGRISHPAVNTLLSGVGVQFVSGRVPPGGGALRVLIAFSLGYASYGEALTAGLRGVRPGLRVSHVPFHEAGEAVARFRPHLVISDGPIAAPGAAKARIAAEPTEPSTIRLEQFS